MAFVDTVAKGNEVALPGFDTFNCTPLAARAATADRSGHRYSGQHPPQLLCWQLIQGRDAGFFCCAWAVTAMMASRRGRLGKELAGKGNPAEVPTGRLSAALQFLSLDRIGRITRCLILVGRRRISVGLGW